LKHRLILMTAYSAGLRAGEVINLKPEHIDSERMLIKIVDGKGRKDRYTMLSVKLLKQLRFYYKKCQPKHLTARLLQPWNGLDMHCYFNNCLTIPGNLNSTFCMPVG
jgi:integrase